jgi:hypothetical protein
MLSVLAPDEVTDLSEVYETLDTKADEAGITALLPGEGTTITVEDLELEAEPLSEDVAKVKIRDGSITVAMEGEGSGLVVEPYSWLFGEPDVDVDEGGARSTVYNNGPRPLEASESWEWSTDDVPGEHRFLMAVRHDGRWYVSPFYSLAEHLLVADGNEEADFGTAAGIDGGATGADSPTAAVEGMLGAMADFDAEAGVPFLSPEQAPMAYDYLDAFLEGSLGEALEDGADDTQAELGDVELSEEAIDDDTTRVVLERVEYSVDDDGEAVDYTLDDDCLTREDEYEEDTSCLSDDLLPGMQDMVPERISVITRSDGGRWYVDPVATVADYLQGAAAGAGPDIVRAVLGVYQPNALTMGTPFEGTLATAASIESHTVAVTEGTRYLVQVSVDGVPVEAVVAAADDSAFVGDEYLYSGSEESRNGDSALITATADTTLAVTVAREDGTDDDDTAEEPASYTVLVREITPLDEPVLEMDVSEEGTFDEPGAVALYRYDAADGDIPSLDAVSEDDGVLDTTLYDEEGYEIVLYEGEELTEGGEYLVLVAGGWDDATGDYEIAISRYVGEGVDDGDDDGAEFPPIEEGTTAAPTGRGNTYQGFFDGLTFQNYSFTGDGSSLTITVTADIETWFEIVGPDNVELEFGSVSEGESRSWTLATEPGATYVFGVQPYSEAETVGTYAVTVQ